MAGPPRPARRRFLQHAGGLTIGFAFLGPWGCGEEAAERREASGPDGLLANAWVLIAPSGTVTIVCPVDELGQGSMTALPLILAEELDAAWDDVRIEFSPPDEATYGNPAFSGMMYVVESVAVSGYFEQLRYCGAQARRILLMNAAEKWGVEPQELTTEPGTVIDRKRGRRLGYGAIAAFATLPETLPEPAGTDLKDSAEFRLIGRSVPRRDIPSKVVGETAYSIDTRLPGMVYATAVRAPIRGAEFAGMDDVRARSVPGLIDILPRKHSVIVAARDSWSALKARRHLSIRWSRVGEVDDFDSEVASEAHARLARDLATPGVTWKERGDAEHEFRAARRIITGEYRSDYVYHAQLEPLNAAVWVKDGGREAEAWVGTQAPAVTVQAIARSTGMDAGGVLLHRAMVGGAFGRRAVHEMDFVDDAAWLSKELERPVKVFWSREDDIASGYFKPMTAQFLRAAVGGRDAIAAWHHRVAVQEPLATAEVAMYEATGRRPAVSMGGAGELVYDVPHQLAEHLETTPGIRTYPLMGVGLTPNLFAAESFMDEIAHELDIDPLEFRLSHLEASPRARRVLERVAELSGWGTSGDSGRSKGIMFATYHGTLLAGAVDLSVEQHAIRVHHIWAAIDPGIAVQPDNIRAQVTGALVFGLGNALSERITFRNGVAEQTNFDDYSVPRMKGAPRIHVEVMANGDAPSAVGQTGAVIVAPAVGNAFARLTGKRLRRMPFTADRVTSVLET